MVIDRILQSWRKRDSVNNAGGTASRRLHLPFLARPVEVRKDENGRVAALVYERTQPDGQGGAVGTGELREVPIQALYRAIGYFGSPLPGVPFDKKHGVIPNREGQVLAKDSNERVSGIYATGWIKRGPVGLIGHTKSDAMETVRHIINDQGSWWHRRIRPRRPSSSCCGSAACAGPTSRGGTVSTSMRSPSALPRSAPASRSCRATRWCASPGASRRFASAVPGLVG